MSGCEGWKKAACVLATLLGVAPAPVLATNGFNFYGFGAESVGVGGADVALVRDTSALVTNPAGLGHIKRRQFDSNLDPYYLVDVRHADSLGNDESTRPRIGGSGSMAYAQRIGDSNLVAGVGAYVAGGLGFEYRGLDTGYGTRDELVTRFSVLRIAPGIAWDLRPGLTLGASLSINYATARLKEFPNSSVVNLLDQQQSLFGSRIDGLTGVGFGLNFGLRYVLDPSERWVLGVAYRSESKLDLEDGKLTVNYESLGAGRIEYHDVSLHGITIPQDLQVGVMFRAADHWKLMGELTWIDWSDAINEFRIQAGDPERNPLPLLIPNDIERRQPLDWRDQLVVALGVMYEPGADWRLSAGYNGGRQPVPRRTLTPLIAAIPEQHFAIGAGRRISEIWDVQFALVYVAKNSVHYENPASRVTADARETHETFALSLGISRSW
jgi:long-chain fatty acid transport protein